MSESLSVELPNELQEIIFKTAARLDGRCALNLLKTARFVHDWVYPILYERVALCSATSADCLLRTLRNQYTYPPQNYALNRNLSLPKPLSFTLSYDISLSQAKPILAQLSKSLITYTIFRTTKDYDHYLGFIRSPFIRRIVIIYKVHSDEPAFVRYPREKGIPVTVLSSLTHLALVSDDLQGAESLQSAFSIASVGDAAYPPPFLHLTCFAISWTRWRSIWRSIALYAKALRCFAVLGPANSQLKESILKNLRPRKDPRIVLINQGGCGEPASWMAKDGFCPSELWSTIEALVKDHYLCDDGEKWGEPIVNAFRLKHPEIHL